MVIPLYTLSPANLAVAVNLPFLATFTFIVATPLELVLALKVLPFTLTVIFLPLIALPFESLRVNLTFLATLTFKAALAKLAFTACFLTVTLTVLKDAL